MATCAVGFHDTPFKTTSGCCGFPKGVSDELLEGPKQHPVTRWLDLSTQTLVDPQADPDGDGRSNLEEYRAGTDPTVPERAAAPEPKF